MATILREGHVTAKANKTDPVFQTFSVRETEQRIEYYNTVVSKWCKLPQEWADKIKWD